MMDIKTIKKKLYRMAWLQCELKKMACLQSELEKLCSELSGEMRNATDALSDVFWNPNQIYYNCKVSDGKLYSADGELLSDDGKCMSEPLGYFVNEWVSDDEFNYYGTMFFQVDDKGTFVGVSYFY